MIFTDKVDEAILARHGLPRPNHLYPMPRLRGMPGRVLEVIPYFNYEANLRGEEVREGLLVLFTL